MSTLQSVDQTMTYLTKREYIAALVLAQLASEAAKIPTYVPEGDIGKLVAHRQRVAAAASVEFADALLREIEARAPAPEREEGKEL